MTQSPRFSVAMFLWLQPNGAAALARFGQAAAPAFQRHDLRIERVLALRGKGQIVGENPHDLPDLFQLISFPDPAAFKAYLTDPDYIALAADRDQALRRMVAMTGHPLDLGKLATPGIGALADRLYGVGLARFKPGGQAGMQAFNEQAQPLFARHGMHLEAMIDVTQVIAPIGETEEFAAERIALFFLDHADSLKPYATDPDYSALAPLRDDGLLSYALFFGGLPAAQAEQS